MIITLVLHGARQCFAGLLRKTWACGETQETDKHAHETVVLVCYHISKPSRGQHSASPKVRVSRTRGRNQLLKADAVKTVLGHDHLHVLPQRAARKKGSRGRGPHRGVGSSCKHINSDYASNPAVIRQLSTQPPTAPPRRRFRGAARAATDLFSLLNAKSANIRSGRRWPARISRTGRRRGVAGERVYAGKQNTTLNIVRRGYCCRLILTSATDFCPQRRLQTTL